MYNYSTEGGRLETDNLLYPTPPALSVSTYAEWYRLHGALTQLLTDSSTEPMDWPTVDARQGTGANGNGGDESGADSSD